MKRRLQQKHWTDIIRQRKGQRLGQTPWTLREYKRGEDYGCQSQRGKIALDTTVTALKRPMGHFPLHWPLASSALSDKKRTADSTVITAIRTIVTRQVMHAHIWQLSYHDWISIFHDTRLYLPNLWVFPVIQCLVDLNEHSTTACDS